MTTDTQTPRICEHGQLARQCEICDLQRELAAVRGQLAEYEFAAEDDEFDERGVSIIDLGHHYTDALSALTERRAYSKSSCAQMIAEQSERAERAEAELAAVKNWSATEAESNIPAVFDYCKSQHSQIAAAKADTEHFFQLSGQYLERSNKAEEEVEALRESLKIITHNLRRWTDDGVRPDEWSLKECASIGQEALAARNGG